jgi:biopolymer transport protein ExbB
MSIWEISPWKLFLSGGPVMIPILICSILAVGIVIEKLWYFFVISTNTQKLKADIFQCLKNHGIKEAVQICEANPSPVAKILKAGILKFGASRDEIKETMEDVSLFEIPRLEKRLSALATIANVSPLLGLLGTVTGMTGSFHTIQVRATANNPVTPGDLAGGIWEALITTVAGLVVAIPTFVAYNYCVSRVNAVVLEMERAATELVNFLSQLSDSQAVPKAGSSLEI